MMIKIAFIFPGQGAQKVGMGKEFYDSSPEAKDVFEQAEGVLPGLTRSIFDGPEDKLTSTAFCQPAILTASVAALRAFEASEKFKTVQPVFAAGLSLGEYSALAAAGALSFKNTLRLVQKRASFMEEATKLQSGTMAAIIGFDKKRLQDICAETGVEVANFNSPEQIVITGSTTKVQKACGMIEKEGAKSVIPLDVSGAFHSSLMRPAAEKFRQELTGINIGMPKLPVVTNVTGLAQDDVEDIRSNLVKQITSSVQWENSVRFVAAQGVTTFLEIGPGRVLKGLIRRIDPGLKTLNIQTPADIEGLLF